MVRTILFEVVWTKRSLNQLQEIYYYIHKDSPVGAKKVVFSISKRIGSLAQHAMIYEADKYKLKNDGSYRATLIYKYRISYRIIEKKYSF